MIERGTVNPMSDVVIDCILDEVRLVEVFQVQGHGAFQLVTQRLENDILLRPFFRAQNRPSPEKQRRNQEGTQSPSERIRV